MSAQVSSEELHTPTVDPSTLNIAPGVELNETQRKHVAIVLDLFKAKGTMAKLKDNFVQEAVYEDPFALSGGLEQFAGQLLNVPLVTRSTKTNHYQVLSNTPSTTTNAKGESVSVDEIAVDFDHEITFRLPLPDNMSTMHLQTTLHIFSDPKSGKMVKLMDHPKEELDTWSLPNFIRKFNSVVVPKLTGLPKDEKEDAEKVMREQR